MLNITISVMSSILMVILGIYIVSKYQVWFEKHRLKLLSIFMILGLIIYTIGYLAKDNTNYLYSSLMAIFSTGRMFVFENDISSFENDVANIPLYNISFGIIMAFSMLIIGMIILSFLGYRILSKIQLKFIRLSFNHNNKIYLFTDLNENGLSLAEDIKIKNKKSKIIFCINNSLDEEENRELEKRANIKRHLLYSINDISEINKFCESYCKKFNLVTFVNDENDNENISFTFDFINYLKTRKRKKMNKVCMYTFIRNNDYEDELGSISYSGLDIHIIDENDLAPRQLFSNFNLISCLGASDILTVCIVGYSDITENIYKNVIYLGQSDGIKLRIILIDEDIQNKTAKFFHKNPQVEKCAEFVFEDRKRNTLDFYKYINQNIQIVNCFILTEEDMLTAFELSRSRLNACASTKICVYARDVKKYQYVLQTHLLKDVTVFGSTKELFTDNIIINETLDKLAKGFNKFYAELYHDTRSWDEISLFEKQSNRALALHVQPKLFTIGLKMVEGGSVQLFEDTIHNEQVLERLAKGEHLRWNAFSYSHGWRTMTDIQNYEKNKDTLYKKHSCLVDWDELDRVSEKFGKDFKEMDRHLVRNIGTVLKSVGCGVEKIYEEE